WKLLKPQNVRCVSLQSFHPHIRDLVGYLRLKQPGFAVRPENIDILYRPSQFYTRLLEMIRTAENKIFISSLYIGSEETELLESLQKALESKPALHVYFQLDLNRCTRPGPSSTVLRLLPLLRAHPDRIHASLFRPPSANSSIIPPRFREGWGTWHAKIYGADDVVMISGANLNRSYFTDRQDRYLHFRDKKLSDYCFRFLNLMSLASYRLALPVEPLTPHSISHPDKSYALVWPTAIPPPLLKAKVAPALRSLQEAHTPSIDTITADDSHVLVFPMIQSGPLGFQEEKDFFRILYTSLKSSLPDTFPPNDAPLILDLTSGYFALPDDHQIMLLDISRALTCRIVVASPQANGFFDSAGLSRLIPEAYTHLEKQFSSAITRFGRDLRVRLVEWAKGTWTYHAKGLWLTPRGVGSFPVLTFFGSSNMSMRSMRYDTELSFVMSNTMTLRRRLGAEVNGIRMDTSEWKGRSRRVSLLTKLLV
ncbi:hypothetical protein FISHEDRAFT_18639, partial [Fistulina hepatica ATCC 64428]